MIKVFGQLDKSFSSNGDIIIHPLRAKVHQEDNSDFYLDLECGLEYVDTIVEGNIVVAPTPSGEQAFRVGNVEKTKTKLKTKAYHVFYDTKNYLIVDSYVVNKNCSEALNHLLGATEPANPFSASSNVSKIDSYRCVRTSLYEAIFTVLERWGGHLVRNNFGFAIWQNIGTDSGVVIRYAKNLKEISSTEDWSEVVTKLLPTGKDGIMLNALDPSASIYLVASISYDLPYTKTISFDQDIDENDYKNPDGTINEQAYKQALIDDLRAQAQVYLSNNCVPKINYTLKADIQQVTDIGDSIEVIDERLGIDVYTNVIAYDYDCILNQYTQIEFGNFQNKLSNYSSQITSKIDLVELQAQQANQAIWNTLEKSYLVYSGNNLMILDQLPQSQAENVLKLSTDGLSVSDSGVYGTFETVIGIDGKIYIRPNNELLVIDNTDEAQAQNVLRLALDGLSIADDGVSGTFENIIGINGVVKLNTNKLTINSKNLDDFILEVGTSSGWHFKKYSSGFCELDAELTLSSLTWSTFLDYIDQTAQHISLLYNTSKEITLPFNVSNKNIQATVKGTSNAWISSIDNLFIGIISKTQETSITVDVHVCGNWS